MTHAGAVEEVRQLKSQLSLAVTEGDSDKQVLLFRQLQEVLLATRDLGNRKLEVSSHLQEIVSCVCVQEWMQ